MSIKKMSVITLFSMLLVAMMWSCDIYKEKNYDVSDIDARGCQLLQKTATTDTVYAIDITVKDTTWVDSTLAANLTEVINYVESQNGVITVSDTSTVTIITPGAAKSVYLIFESSLTGVVFFINDYLTINLFNGDGTTVTKSNETIDLVTALYATPVNPDAEIPEEWEMKCDGLKGRIVYASLNGTKKLLQIIKTDQIAGHTYRLAFVSNE